jgi:hypothetical protein
METPATQAGSDRGATVRPAGEDLRVTLAALDASAAVGPAPATPAPVRPVSSPAGWGARTRTRLLAGGGLVALLLVGLVVALTGGSGRAPQPAARHSVVRATHPAPARVATPAKAVTPRRTSPHHRRRTVVVHHKVASPAVVPAPHVVVAPAPTAAPAPKPQPVSRPAPKPTPRPPTGGTSCSFPPC